MQAQGAAAGVVTRRTAEAQGEFARAGDLGNITPALIDRNGLVIA